MKKIEHIIFFGDIHTEFKIILDYIKKYDLRNAAFISCGDFGIGFKSTKKSELRTLEYYNTPFVKRNIHIFVVRGNHDNPEYFNNNFKLGNFTFLKDYELLKINNLNILPLGGAISIDRNPNILYKDYRGKYWKGRKLNTDYWIDEAFQYKSELVDNLFNVDIVVSHDAPNFCFPYQKNGLEKWAVHDKTLISECSDMRDNLSNVYNTLIKNNNIKYWFYGHYHLSNSTLIDNTNFILLDINEFFNLNY